MTDLPRRFAVPLALAILAVLVLAACAGGAAPSAPAAPGAGGASSGTSSASSGTSAAASDAAGSSEATPSASEPSTSEAPAASDPGASAGAGGGIGQGTPTGCVELGPQDCERVRSLAATVLTDADPAVVYVQVGPFGCLTGDRCPLNLLARPEGDVVIEFAAGTGINVHLKVAADGSFEATRSEAIGIAVPPASPPDGLAGPREFVLGHCGVFSGIDVDGSYWDVVGPISYTTGEAINATTGVLSLTDPDHGTFTTPTGFSVQLIRHVGPKLLPLCM